MTLLNNLRLRHAGLILAATVMLGSPVSAQTAIKFSLDFKFEGPAAPFLVAIDKGYFKAEGLDVTIDTAAAHSNRSTASPPAPTTWASETSIR